MKQSKSFRIRVVFPLLLSLSILSLFFHQGALARRAHSFHPEQEKLISKAKLIHSSLDKRMQWLENEVPPRIQDPLKELGLEKGKTALTLIVYKKERSVELWKSGLKPKFIKSYPMTGFSGKLGPKNKQGDRQIPEGIYKTHILNPNSKYHLSIGINYPNDNDKKRGKKNKIRDLGGDIFIHGKNVTIGCVPIGDQWIEELFYIVGKVGLKNTEVFIAPSHLPFPSFTELGLDGSDDLIKEKYLKLSEELKKFASHSSQ